MSDLLVKLKEHAKENGVHLNPDERVIEMLVRALEKNGGYCPCRVGKSLDNVCPCVSHLDEIKKNGHCHCFLFVR